MGIYKVKDRRGRRRYVFSKYWPHGSGRLRMYAPNYRSAQALHTRIESSILDGTWKQLKQELAGGNCTIWTVLSFYERFFEEYCKPRIRSRRRYALSFKSLNAMLGKIPLKEFQRKDLYRYVAKRKEQVKPATVNRDIATISKKVALRADRGVHMGQRGACAQRGLFDVHGHFSIISCSRYSYASTHGSDVPIGGEWRWTGATPPFCLPDRHSGAGRCVQACHRLGGSLPFHYPCREGQ